MQTKHLYVLIHIRIKDEIGTMKLVSNFQTDHSKGVLLLCLKIFICIFLCHIVLSQGVLQPCGQGHA